MNLIGGLLNAIADVLQDVGTALMVFVVFFGLLFIAGLWMVARKK